MRDYSIANLMQMVRDNELVLPAMQRPFVWDADRMIRLFDSLLRGFPLGSLLVWSTGAAQRYRPFLADARTAERPLDTFPRAEGRQRLLYVLDGQQRLTTLLVGTLGTLDDRPLYLNVFSGDPEDKDPGDTYWDLRFLTGSELMRLNEEGPAKDPHEYFVPFARFLELGPVRAGSAAVQLARSLGLSDDADVDQLSRSFTQAATHLADPKALHVHPIDDHGVEETPLAEILEIFVRVNSGGLRLQKADLLMSLLDMSWDNVQPALVKLANDVSRIGSLDVTRDMLLKAALLSIGEDSRFDNLVKSHEHVARIAPALEECLPRLESAWRSLAVLVVQDAKIASQRFFRRATRALLPFAVYLMNNPSPPPGERRRMVAGLYVALASGVFASAEARMGSFTRDNCRSRGVFPLEPLCRMVRRYRNLTSLDEVLQSHRDLALNVAHAGSVVLDGNPDDLERDHVFPRAMLRAAGEDEARIDHYANLHFLRARDNRNKTDKAPHDWFAKPGDAPPYSEEDMASRLLSWDLVQPGKFADLIEVRGAAIRRRALELFGMDEQSFSALFTSTGASSG